VSRDGAPCTPGASTLHIGYRPPFDWDVILAHLAHLASRAVDGVERVIDGGYHRVIAESASVGTATITHAPEQRSLCVEIALPGIPATSDERARAAVVERVRTWRFSARRASSDVSRGQARNASRRTSCS
jgi:hypothetical protein